MKRKCDECRTKFEAKTTWQRFCSPLCRLRANRRMLKQAARELNAKNEEAN